ncbi:hypothetical protein ACFYY8_31820 [Streptosporangium sp. NPDC001559]|uniref:hypothetical protein n=1 Tax=Streptosporangium sp. NPDC001559 TaxID=3366187 RepID=UPI0036E1EB70
MNAGSADGRLIVGGARRAIGGGRGGAELSQAVADVIQPGFAAQPRSGSPNAIALSGLDDADELLRCGRGLSHDSPGELERDAGHLDGGRWGFLVEVFFSLLHLLFRGVRAGKRVSKRVCKRVGSILWTGSGPCRGPVGIHVMDRFI